MNEIRDCTTWWREKRLKEGRFPEKEAMPKIIPTPQWIGKRKKDEANNNNWKSEKGKKGN